jgi:hypothetical protein
MASQLPIIYRDLVPLSMTKMAERYGAAVSVPPSVQVNREAWDVHQDSCFYEELEDSFLDVPESFKARKATTCRATN